MPLPAVLTWSIRKHTRFEINHCLLTWVIDFPSFSLCLSVLSLLGLLFYSEGSTVQVRTERSLVKNILWFLLAKGWKKKMCEFLCMKWRPFFSKSQPSFPYFFVTLRSSTQYSRPYGTACDGQTCCTLSYLLSLKNLCVFLSAFSGCLFPKKLIFKSELKLPPSLSLPDSIRTNSSFLQFLNHLVHIFITIIPWAMEYVRPPQIHLLESSHTLWLC